MNILHCADLHLDSRMESNLDGEKARIRREELLETWERMVDYAATEDVRLILIAGDMFDRPIVPRSVASRVMESVRTHPDIDFLYLRGNHDLVGQPAGLRAGLPENLKTFTDFEWTSYDYGEVVVTGREMTEENADQIACSLDLDQDRFNIVMLHGQIAVRQRADLAESIPLEDLKGRGIDYLALGHLHTYQQDRLDARGIYCYPGCLEGRGFDECGPKGFVLLHTGLPGRCDTNPGDSRRAGLTTEFIPFARRQLHDISVPLRADDTMLSVISKTDESVADISQDDLIRVTLTGSISMDLVLDTPRVARHLLDRFFFARVDDNTTTAIDYNSYLNDRTIRGEFMRLMRDADLDERTRAAVTRIGMKALSGEDPEE